jgi:hypothetical protein
MKNLTNLLVVLAAICLVWGCGFRRTVDSAGKDCLSADGSQIALTDMYGGITLIDSRTGKILSKKETEKDGPESGFGVALCTQNNEIFSVYPDVLVNLKDNQRTAHQVKGNTIFDALDEETFLTFSGGILTTDSKGRYDRARPLEIYLEKLGQETKDLKPLMVGLDKFEGLRKDASEYWIRPLRLLNENLLIIAGARPQTYSQILGEITVSPEPWGLYLFNLKTEQAKILGTIKKADAEINFHDSPKVSSTKDGRLISLFTFVGEGNSFAIYDTKQDKEIMRKTIKDGEISGVTFLNDQTKIAVLVKHNQGSQNNRVQYSANIYNLKTGNLMKTISFNFNPSGVLDFRNDELIILNHQKISKIDVNTEGQIWETVYFDK